MTFEQVSDIRALIHLQIQFEQAIDFKHKAELNYEIEQVMARLEAI